MSTIKAVVYSRVSTEDQADYGTGLETQEIESRRFADRIGARVIAHESDPGVSGTIYPRPGLETALAMLESGAANALIAHRVDRIGRKVFIPPLVYERIKEARARLFTVEDGEVTEDNILVFSLRCGLAQTDYNRIVQNLKAGKRRLAEKGRIPIRSLSPYGYHVVRKVEAGQVREDAGTCLIIPEEAEVVRTIFQRYATGDTLSGICRYLQTEGIPTPKPQKSSSQRSLWQPTMVARILKETTYKGYKMWGKTVTTYKDRSALTFDERLQSRKQDGKKRISLPTPETAQVRISVPPIVSEELWEACQRKREENRVAGGVRNDRKHLFASLVTCPMCRRRMLSGRANYHKRTTEQKPVLYRCRDHAPSQNAAGHVCHRAPYKEERIQDAVRRFFKALTDTPEFVAAALADFQASRRCQESVEDLRTVEAALREVEQREAATAQAYARAIQLGAREEVFEKLFADIAGERKRLAERKAEVEAALKSMPEEDPQEVAEIVALVANDILEALDADDLTPVEKNTWLRRVLQEIRPVGDDFEIVARPIQVQNQLPPVTSIVMPVR